MTQDARSLTVTIIQSSQFWENKDANLQMFAEKIRNISQRTELIILPEMFSTGFTMQPERLAETMDGETLRWLKEISHEKKAAITGSFIAKEDNHYFNRLIWMLPDGSFGHYDKRHLFSFAGEHEHYMPGNKKLIASLKGWRINLQVCYDLRFPVWARQPAEAEKQYDLYINVANWPSKRRAAWKTLLTARAIENQAYVIGVNRVGTDGNGHHYSGDSMIIDPAGEVLYHKEDDEDVFTFTLDKQKVLDTRRHFPFLNDADNYRILDL